MHEITLHSHDGAVYCVDRNTVLIHKILLPNFYLIRMNSFSSLLFFTHVQPSFSMKNIFCALLACLAITIAVFANDAPIKDFQRSYKYWQLQVNRNGITYADMTFPCFDPDARCMGVYDPTMEYEKYEINVLDNGNVTCNERYQTGNGDLQRTAYSGRCFGTGPATYLITCRDPPKDPQASKGWAILHFKSTHTYFSTRNGAKARFAQELNNTVEANPFVDHDYSRDLFASVEIFCPIQTSEG